MCEPGWKYRDSKKEVLNNCVALFQRKEEKELHVVFIYYFSSVSILTEWLFFSVVPFGTKNKFSMPCNVTLHGAPMFEQACKDALRRRGYTLLSTNNKYTLYIWYIFIFPKIL